MPSPASPSEFPREFARKRRRLLLFALVILSLFLVLVVVGVLGLGGGWRFWILAGGGVLLFATLVAAKLDWACPSCGRLFRKGSYFARFCPRCGVRLLDGK